jgi:hypothetical protein
VPKRLWFVLALTLAAAGGFSRAASAYVTAFLGLSPTPSSRLARGFAVGFSLVVVGFEFEYATTSEKTLDLAPWVRTGMFNGLLQTPVPIKGMQFYATAGGGLYRETLGIGQVTNVGLNIGGGVKVRVAGPLRLRLDYRIFRLSGNALYPHPQRLYAGLNFGF